MKSRGKGKGGGWKQWMKKGGCEGCLTCMKVSKGKETKQADACGGEQMLIGVIRSIQGQAGVHRGKQVHAGVSRCMQGRAGAPRGEQVHAGESR